MKKKNTLSKYRGNWNVPRTTGTAATSINHLI